MHALQPHHTFALPHFCQNIVEVEDPQWLRTFDFTQQFCLLGEGSNTVFIDDFLGVVLKLTNKGVVISQSTTDWKIDIAAGENWHSLVILLLDNGISGLENLALIPGTVGAAPVQNIGAYGVELADFLEYVEGFNIQRGQFERLSRTQCQFGYRDSIFKNGLKNRFVITKVGLSIAKDWQPQLHYGPLQALDKKTVSGKEVFDAVVAIRQSKLPDPKELANSGSFFKNPLVNHDVCQRLLACYPTMPTYKVDAKMTKLAAGWLIEQAGLKGYRYAGVRVYERQALVLVNEGHASGGSLRQIVQHIQRQVAEQFGVDLEHEVILIGPAGEEHIKERIDE